MRFGGNVTSEAQARGVGNTNTETLANERTYLAWWRTGLTVLAVSLGAGKLIPALAPGVQRPYTLARIGFAGYRDRIHRLRLRASPAR